MHGMSGRNGTQFFYNGDFSGPIQVIKPNGEEFEIDGQDLQDLSSSIFKSKVIALIEGAII